MSEQLALNAKLRMGELCPERESGRPAAGEKLATAANFAREVGISRRAAREWRALARARDAAPDEVTAAIFARDVGGGRRQAAGLFGPFALSLCRKS